MVTTKMGKVAIQQIVKVKKGGRIPNPVVELPEILTKEKTIKSGDSAKVFIEKDDKKVSVIYEFELEEN